MVLLASHLALRLTVRPLQVLQSRRHFLVHSGQLLQLASKVFLQRVCVV